MTNFNFLFLIFCFYRNDGLFISKKLPYRTDNFRLRGMKIQALPEIQKTIVD